jgi:nucleolar protein 56
MEDFKKLRELNIKETKKKVKDSVTDDLMIVQSVNHIEDINKVVNILIKDLREWYSYYNPEFSEQTIEHEEFVDSILNKKDKKIKDGMGADLKKEDLTPIIELCTQIDNLYKFRQKQEKYLESMMNKICPNITAISTYLIGAKLIKHAGSLKRLFLMPSSTIQLLGAEEALFRHIKTGARCPKYGVLHNHPLISKVDKKDVGKVARMLASKISIASKVDFGKGKFIGDKLLKEIEDRFK